MRKMHLAAFPILLLTFELMVVTQVNGQNGRKLTVGVIRDGTSSGDTLSDQIAAEVRRLLPEAEIMFKEVPEFDAGWQQDRVSGVIEAALADTDVDILLGIGSLVTVEAAKVNVRLTKPFMSASAIPSGLVKLPYEDNRWTKENFSAILIPQRIDRDIRTFKSLIPFKKLHIVLAAEQEPYLVDALAGLRDYERDLDVQFILVPISTDLDRSIANLPNDIQAVYLTRLPRLSGSQRQSLIDSLTARKIPTFSLVGHEDVRRGALAGVSPDIRLQIVRRVGLNLHQVIRGVPTTELPVILTAESNLLVNGRTAASIDYSPDVETRLFADFIDADALTMPAERLTFGDALRQAQKSNTSLSISDADVETAKNEMQITRSQLLPQVLGSGSYQSKSFRVDDPEGLLPDQLGNVGFTVRQMIYDDRVISDYRSSKSLYHGVQEGYEADRLNVMADAGQTYLSLVLAQVLNEVERDNVRLTQDNLELSRLRQDVGYSGRDEVYRWEAELADRRSSFLDSQALLEAQRIALNQVFGLTQSLRWSPEEIPVDPEIFPFIDGRIDPIYDLVASWERFRAFSVDFAVQNAPELRFLRKAIDAQEIQKGQRNRRFYLPSLSASFSYDYRFYSSSNLVDADKDAYSFRVSAAYPIFTGLARLYDARRASSLVEGLTQEERLSRELVEQRVRTALRKMESSFPRIQLSAMSAASAAKNLDIVQDKYAQGIVNVTDLLDAQNQSFRAQQNAAAATYAFLGDLVAFQRAIAWFEDEKDQTERDQLYEKIQEAVASQ